MPLDKRVLELGIGGEKPENRAVQEILVTATVVLVLAPEMLEGIINEEYCSYLGSAYLSVSSL